MIAATYTQGGEFRVEEIPAPAIEAGDILLRVRAASICGTDVKIIRNGHRKLRPGQRIVLGHEFAGEIVEVGGDVRGYRPGQRVGVVPNAGCGTCDPCIRARANYCPEYTAFGIDRDGAHAEYVRIPARFLEQGNVMPLPASISDPEASVLEPFSCVVGGIRASRVELGDTAVIYGAGPIGLMHLLLLRVSGAARIAVVDPEESRLETAARLGADLVVSPAREDVRERLLRETEGRGVDVAVTACPAPEAQEEAIGLLAPFGRLCLFGGLPRGSGSIRFDSNAVHYGNLMVTGSTGGSAEDYRIALRLVASKRVRLEALISDVLELSRLDEAYELALRGAAGKVALVARG